MSTLSDALTGPERVYGKYAGVVRDNADPLGIGRVQAEVPAVFGEVLTGWALPCLPAGGGFDRGFYTVPEIGDTVWVEFEAGDVSRPIWSGTFWGAPSSTGGDGDLGTDTGAEAPTADDAPAEPGRTILRTVAGHTILLDDANEVVLIAHGGGAEIRITKEGEVIVKAPTVKLEADTATLDAGAIELGAGASEPVVLGNAFLMAFNQHTHGHPMGPTGPPVPPLASSALSQTTKTK